MLKTEGIHHITAIVGHPQENVDFYAGILGLRLVKTTVNFDDPGTYHFYFGNEKGSPGTIITFFPWVRAYKGRIGSGQVGVTTYIIPPNSMSFWENRLDTYNISYKKTERFGENYLYFEDVHGLHIELVERQEGEINEWSFNGVTQDVAIKGFGGAVLFSANPTETIRLLKESMGLVEMGRNEEYVRLRAIGEVGNMIDVRLEPMPRGRMGVGTVHHIAWRTIDDEEQLKWQQYLVNHGFSVTPVQDRNYFQSIYFREHGEILFEIATDPPGFAIDESIEHLGESLKLPPQYEKFRTQLESQLLPFQVREVK